jgi:hypothetical protein
MSRRLPLALLVAAAGLVGWAFAQPRPAPAERGETPAGRYAVSPVGRTAVMVETATGKTWLLHETVDSRRFAWLPVPRIDDPDEAQKWLAMEESLRRDQEKAREDLLRRSRSGR